MVKRLWVVHLPQPSPPEPLPFGKAVSDASITPSFKKCNLQEPSATRSPGTSSFSKPARTALLECAWDRMSRTSVETISLSASCSVDRRFPWVGACQWCPPQSPHERRRTSFWTDGSGAPCRLCGASHRRLPQGNLRRNLKSHWVSNDFRSARVEARCLRKYMKSLTCVLSAQGPLGQPTQWTLPIAGIIRVHNDRFNRFK